MTSMEQAMADAQNSNPLDDTIEDILGSQKQTGGFMKKKAKKKAANKAVAFFNWAVPLADGGIFKCKKGLPIFNNPKYPNPHEQKLVELAKKNGGSITMNMTVTINILKDEKAELPQDDLFTFVTE